MNLAEQVLSFDDLLNAVQESSRGRWFLGKYEERIRSTGTENILSSIAKLENAIAGMAHVGGDNALLSRAKAAIAAARKDIANLDQNQGDANISNEARLFAKLADMARASLSADGKANDNAVVNTGVVRALRLVDELDQAMATVQPATNYFAPHAEVFEAAPKAAIAAPVAVVAPIVTVEKSMAKPEPKADIERGAKLTITRGNAAPIANAVVVSRAAEAPAPEVPAQKLEPVVIEPLSITNPPSDLPYVDAPAAAATATEVPTKSRVVIIRRKPEELMAVPMVEETPALSDVTSAA